MRRSKKTYFRGFILLMIGVFLSVHTTFAWLREGAANDDSIIEAGDTGMEMYWTKDIKSDKWIDVEKSGEPIFNCQYWEPGYTEVRYIKIKNIGDIPLEYEFTLVAENPDEKLADVIDVYLIDDVTENVEIRNAVSEMKYMGTLTDIFNGKIMREGVLSGSDTIDAQFKSDESTMAIVLQMKENADNKYQNQMIKDGFSIRVIATQLYLQ